MYFKKLTKNYRIRIPFSDFLWVFICIFFFLLSKSINFNISKQRGWPPISIYYHHLPDEFNKDLLKPFDSSFFESTHIEYQFFLEIFFSKHIKETPLITDNMETADFIYLDYFPTYHLYHHLKNKEMQSNGTIQFYNYLKANKLNKKHLFYLAVFPIVLPAHRFLIGYKGCYERLWGIKFFIVPYLSNFDHFPPDSVDFNEERNITVFLQCSPIKKRRMIFDVMKNINNSLGIEMKREQKSDKDKLYQLPYLISKSKYCIVPRGDSSSSKRFYDAVVYGCIPIIISNRFKAPFNTTQINWDECTLRLDESNISQLPDLIANISDDKYRTMFSKLMEAREFIRFESKQMFTIQFYIIKCY